MLPLTQTKVTPAKKKRKYTVAFSFKSYKQHMKPTKIKANVSSKQYPVTPIKHYENSMGAKAKLTKMTVGQSIFVTRKELQHFYDAARFNGFKITSRQGKINRNKVRVWKTA